MAAGTVTYIATCMGWLPGFFYSAASLLFQLKMSYSKAIVLSKDEECDSSPTLLLCCCHYASILIAPVVVIMIEEI